MLVATGNELLRDIRQRSHPREDGRRGEGVATGEGEKEKSGRIAVGHQAAT